MHYKGFKYLIEIMMLQIKYTCVDIIFKLKLKSTLFYIEILYILYGS